MRIRNFVFALFLLTETIAIGAQKKTEYLAIFMDGKKVGYAVQSREASNGKVTTTEKVSLTMSRMNMAINLNTEEVSIETSDGKPLGFRALQELSGMGTKIEGTVDNNGTVNLTVASMGNEQESEMEWPNGAVMAEGARLFALKNGLKEGTKYNIKIFSPSLMQALDTDIVVGPKKSVDLLGRVVFLTEMVSKTKMAEAGEIESRSYVDDQFWIKKNIIPIMGTQMEMVACPKEFAMGRNDVFEVIDKMFLKSPAAINNISEVKSINYQLSPTDEAANLVIPASDNQRVKKLENGQFAVTVKPVAMPEGESFPYTGTDKAALEALKPTAYIQSDNKEIIALAQKAVGEEKDAGKAARKIEAFVAKYIEKKNLSIGYASAAETAASKQGDCSEFAVLTAAMCKAVGIPARMVVGIAYVKNFAGVEDRFGGHAWVETYVGGKWVGLDSAFKSSGLGGFDAGHIALAKGNGDPADFFNLINTFGKFQIDKIEVEN